MLIIDTTDRPDIEALVLAHAHLPPGDANCQWADIDYNDGKINLVLTFRRPAEVIVILEFDVLHQGGLVDQILMARSVYLQPGRAGDRLATTWDHPRIIVEIPETGFGEIWEKLIRKTLTKDFKRHGMSRHDAKRATDNFLERWRELSRMRIKRH